MSEIVDMCQNVRGQLRTVGLSASGICPPGQRQAFEVSEDFDGERRTMVFCFQLLDDEIELGMGIHGESGVQKLKSLPCRQLVELTLAQLFRNTRAFDLKPGSSVLLFVNNLGTNILYLSSIFEFLG